MCDLLKSKVEHRDFLEKLEDAQASVPQNTFGMSSDQSLIVGLSGNSKQEDYTVYTVYTLENGYLDFTGPYNL